ncbi:MAG: sulfurtransferase TusA family protein [Clostridium sp.]
MLKIDTRGMSCPAPVVMTKKALDSGVFPVEVLADNNTAKGNIERYARNNGFNIECSAEGEDHLLVISK